MPAFGDGANAACTYSCENCGIDPFICCSSIDTNYNCSGVCQVDIDCNGECGGVAVVDSCGVCGGDNTTCVNCADNTTVNPDGTQGACNFNPSMPCLTAGGCFADADFEECIYPDASTNCCPTTGCTGCSAPGQAVGGGVADCLGVCGGEYVEEQQN
mgnify:CR=1 FL=1